MNIDKLYIKTKFKTARSYLLDNRREVTMYVVALIVLVFLATLFLWNKHQQAPHIVYQPVEACKKFTPEKAMDLLGDEVISVDKNKPVITSDMAESTCSYSDKNSASMKVAAVKIRSAINDDGIKQNKTEFGLASLNDGREHVDGIGQSAFFVADKTSPQAGQLNVLTKRGWMIFSYGVGDNTQENTLDDVIKLAKSVLQ